MSVDVNNIMRNLS